MKTRAIVVSCIYVLVFAMLPGCGPRQLPKQTTIVRGPRLAVEDSAVIARGWYLVNGPAHCVACHTAEGPLTPLDPDNPPAMAGGYAFHVPGGKVRAPNLTSDPQTGVGMRSDIELVNALRYGRRPEGGALLPFMELQGLSDEDIVAIISYLRSLAPVCSEVKVRDINWFGRTLIKLFVHSKEPSAPPPKHNPTALSIELGEYLTNHVAMCVSCHTRRSSTGGYKGKRLSGGFHMADELNSLQELVTPNLTPDWATGHIINWTEERFIARFRQGRLIPGSPMPWSSYALMNDDDLRSIYRFLMSLAPVRHDVGLIVRTKH